MLYKGLRFVLLVSLVALAPVAFRAYSLWPRSADSRQRGPVHKSVLTASPAVTLTVNTLVDADDGACAPVGIGNGCTLREAINAANLALTDDTIVFSVAGTVVLAATLPNIAATAGAGRLIIDGTGGVAVSGNDAVRQFIVDAGADLTLQNIMVRNGRVSGGNGGALFNSGGTIAIINSTFSNNNVVNFGNGGAIWNDGGGTINITSSTFNGNSSLSSGAIRNFSGTLNVTNSTFYSNQAVTFAGGGIENSSTATVTNSTFSGNTAGAGFGGDAIYSGGTTTIRNSILGGGPTGACSGPGTNTDLGGNLVWPLADGTCPGTMPHGDPTLAAPANNGGPTLTMRPQTGSAAIDAGDDCVTLPPGGGGCLATPLTTDQRGFARKVGAHVDVGAFETLGSTAAGVVVSGRITTADGRGIRNVRISVIGRSLAHPVTVLSSGFGYYTLDGLRAGQAYVVMVDARQYTFQVPNRVISLTDSMSDLNFTADR